MVHEMNIPMPKLSHNFLVKFKSVLGVLDETSYALSRNLVSVSEYKEPVANFFGLQLRESVTFVFRDDRDDSVYEGIQTLKNSDELEIVLEYLGGEDTILRAIKLEDPIIGDIVFSKLDYANSSIPLTIELSISYTGLTKL
jgi:hypothetical protein